MLKCLREKIPVLNADLLLRFHKTQDANQYKNRFTIISWK
ncbi:hypothetical protein Salpa_5229 [Sporomusa sp. KB1]|nr:hypothetical protein Salpa_5229 [Sporomusa sp. KB1]